uniref:Uncharacterized protein n=1 Tax=Dulem virus 42 TaxID=3145760 RepID=A0AAU8B9I6_9CAUD
MFYIDSIDHALGIRFYLYALHIQFHLYTLGWLPITVGTRFSDFSTTYLQYKIFPIGGRQFLLMNVYMQGTLQIALLLSLYINRNSIILYLYSLHINPLPSFG